MNGAVAQLGERLLCKQEVTGSIPVSSTTRAVSKWQLAISQNVLRVGSPDLGHAWGHPKDGTFEIRLIAICYLPVQRWTPISVK
jgi:hypothetical protein